MAQNQNDEQSDAIENLEAPVRELTEEEAIQVEGGATRPGLGVLKTQPTDPAPLKIKMTDILISS